MMEDKCVEDDKKSVLKCKYSALVGLRKAVIERYGKLYGLLEKEINKALIDRANKLRKKVSESVTSSGEHHREI